MTTGSQGKDTPQPADGWLYHIAERADWEAAAGGNYLPAGYADEGFIHLSHGHQVLATAARYYTGRDGLAVLRIDPARLAARVVEENLLGGEERFPHLYGPLEQTAIVAVGRLEFGPRGSPVITFRSG